MNRNPKRDAYIAIAFALIFVMILCAASFVIARPFLFVVGCHPGDCSMAGIYVVQTSLGQAEHARGGADDSAAGACLIGPLAPIGAAMTEKRRGAG